MTATRFVFVQSGAGTAALTPQQRDQIREQIRQATEDAIRGTREGIEGANITVTPDKQVFVTPHPPQPPTPPVPGLETITLQPAPFGPQHDVIPPEAVDMAYGFFIMLAVMVVGWPIARAFGRRIERSAPQALQAPAAEQLVRIEQAVEAMAIEVERISESQRFMARIQSESAERV